MLSFLSNEQTILLQHSTHLTTNDNGDKNNNNSETIVPLPISNPSFTTINLDTLLIDLQPVIHYTAQFLRLIQWRDISPKHSLLSLLTWIAFRLLHNYILYLLPFISLIAAVQTNYYFQLSNTATRHQIDIEAKRRLLSSVEEDLTEVRNAFSSILLIKEHIQKSDTLCKLYHKHYSMATVKQRSIICFVVACLFTMTYVGWTIILHQQIIQSYGSILWFIILMVMCLNSPWASPIHNAITHLTILFIHYIIESTVITPQKYHGVHNYVNKIEYKTQQQEDQYTINGYCFELYHHQRWWFPTGWSNLLLPQDRPVWSDIHLESTPSIYEFRLPLSSYFGKPNELNQQKIVSWTWIDPSWSKQKSDLCCDKDGWQYGSWKWKSWSSQSNGLGVCTRRQKWVRYAQRREYWVQLDASANDKKQLLAFEIDDTASCCGSLIGGSNTSASSISSSIYNWDDITTTNTTASDDDCKNSNNNESIIPPSLSSRTSLTTTLTMKPILISNVINDKMRRFSHSVTFNNTPILSCNQPSSISQLEEDNMYKQFCISPKPNNKAKRHSII